MNNLVQPRCLDWLQHHYDLFIWHHDMNILKTSTRRLATPRLYPPLNLEVERREEAVVVVAMLDNVLMYLAFRKMGIEMEDLGIDKVIIHQDNLDHLRRILGKKCC